MSFIDAVKTIFNKPEDREEISSVYTIDVPESVYVREMAVYTSVSLIANAISQSEIRVYNNNKAVKNEDYFTLNVKANPNQSASEFWHKVIEKVLRAEPGKGALCFVYNRNIYCADNYTVEEKRPFLGNLYSGIVVDDFQMNRKYRADDVLLFKLENETAYNMIKRWHSEYGELISTAMDAYKDTNGKKFILKVEGIEAGNKKFKEEFENFLKEPIKKFIKGETDVLIEYDGRKLNEMDRKLQSKSSEDSINTIEETFKVAGRAYHIPEALSLGNITNMNDVVKAFITFAVDPVADMIGKTLTGQRGYEEWTNGNYYKCDTSTINHIDIFDMADKIDKLISSSFACVDEVREKAGLDRLNEEWSSKHLLTKNYEFTENILKEGGN